jgi:hypothetical protein
MLCFANNKNDTVRNNMQDVSIEKELLKKWRLVQSRYPKIGSNDIPLGESISNYDTTLIAEEILLINQNNTYSLFWKHQTGLNTNEETGTWVMSEHPDWQYKMIHLKCTNYTGKTSYNLTDWYIKEVTALKLTLMFQTRGGEIVKSYIPAK